MENRRRKATRTSTRSRSSTSGRATILFRAMRPSHRNGIACGRQRPRPRLSTSRHWKVSKVRHSLNHSSLQVLMLCRLLTHSRLHFVGRVAQHGGPWRDRRPGLDVGAHPPTVGHRRGRGRQGAGEVPDGLPGGSGCHVGTLGAGREAGSLRSRHGCDRLIVVLCYLSRSPVVCRFEVESQNEAHMHWSFRNNMTNERNVSAFILLSRNSRRLSLRSAREPFEGDERKLRSNRIDVRRPFGSSMRRLKP